MGTNSGKSPGAIRERAQVLLIFPPVGKACEPPAGIAMLAAALAAHDIPCALLDANLEGQLHLLRRRAAASDTWTRRAVRNAERNIAALRDPAVYGSPARYRRAVSDLERVLSRSGADALVGLADYAHRRLSPLRSADLLAAALRPEEDPFFPYFRDRLRALMEERSPRFVGFSVNFQHQALCAFAMIGHIRREFPGVKIVLGGGLVTSWMNRSGWRDPFGGLVDSLVAGPGEKSLLELLGATAGGPVRRAPEYGSLRTAGYFAPGFVLPYSASSGCAWKRCSFCPEAAEDNPYQPVPPREAIADLRRLVRETRPVLIHLLDNAVSPGLLAALAAQPPGAPWYGFGRIGPELTDRDFCRALRKAGCVMLKLGLESGDQAVLDGMRKGIELSTASAVLRNLRETGIAAYVYLLFGTPAETESAARRTLAFTAGHADAIGFLNLAVFNMPVNAPEAATHGTGPFYEGDLSLSTGFRHPRGWDRPRVRRFLDREFRRHPAVAAILRKDPPVFTSSHAAFFLPR